jgi:hypothetical protein
MSSSLEQVNVIVGLALRIQVYWERERKGSDLTSADVGGGSGKLGSGVSKGAARPLKTATAGAMKTSTQLRVTFWHLLVLPTATQLVDVESWEGPGKKQSTSSRPKLAAAANAMHAGG